MHFQSHTRPKQSNILRCIFNHTLVQNKVNITYNIKDNNNICCRISSYLGPGWKKKLDYFGKIIPQQYVWALLPNY